MHTYHEICARFQTQLRVSPTLYDAISVTEVLTIPFEPQRVKPVKLVLKDRTSVWLIEEVDRLSLRNGSTFRVLLASTGQALSREPAKAGAPADAEKASEDSAAPDEEDSSTPSSEDGSEAAPNEELEPPDEGCDPLGSPGSSEQEVATEAGSTFEHIATAESIRDGRTCFGGIEPAAFLYVEDVKGGGPVSASYTAERERPWCISYLDKGVSVAIGTAFSVSFWREI